MIEWMVEVEDVSVARPVDDMMKMKSSRSGVQRGRSKGVQGFKLRSVGRLSEVLGGGKAVKTPTGDKERLRHY